jgi:hypothetical protein
VLVSGWVEVSLLEVSLEVVPPPPLLEVSLDAVLLGLVALPAADVPCGDDNCCVDGTCAVRAVTVGVVGFVKSTFTGVRLPV